MYAISLTSIPPRLPRLGLVLQSLLAQEPAPDAVHLYLPRVWERFGPAEVRVDAPDGVDIHIMDEDDGPGMKAISFARHHQKSGQRLIYCDDDWIYPQDWAAALLAAGEPDHAVAASGFDVHRLKRVSAPKPPGLVDIAQGFGGVSIDPAWFNLKDIAPPPAARMADDIWLSGQLARQGISIRLCAAARVGLQPAFVDEHGLQDLAGDGQARADVNRAALEALTDRYGIWPAM